MKIAIAARQSHLARLQAYAVGRALVTAQPGVEIAYQFRESLGDLNAHDPLWKMPEKGVFTQDFHADLIEGRADLVVHSWKDLPLERSPGTLIAATLPREDSRDLLLVRRDRWVESGAQGVEILTSSPRRAHNLASFLSWALPQPCGPLRFTPVRGNIPTRLRKLMEGSAHGLVVAKAALDRLLSHRSDDAFGEEMSVLQIQLREWLARCQAMVLPLSANPTAAAQGALAMEVSERARPEILRLLERVNCAATFAAVERERQVLGAHGGGCHQKIGVSVQPRAYGEVFCLRGVTDAGQTLEERELRSGAVAWPPALAPDRLFPLDPKQASFFDRHAIEAERPATPRAWWVARADAWPALWRQLEGDWLWTAGLESWRKCAARGLWVNGTADGLGEDEPARLESLGGPLAWTKLSHEEGVRTGFAFQATYRLQPKILAPNLAGKTHFYWMSGSAFLRALELHPEIAGAWHFCGPGHTLRLVRERLGATGHVQVCLDHRSWLKNMLAKNS